MCRERLGVAAPGFLLPHIFMASLVEIGNLALGEVAEQTINTLDDATTPARAVKRYIAHSIREALAEAKWKCAREAAVLTQDATAPLFGWDYAYQLPVDFLRMVSFNDTDPDNVVAELFEVRGRRVLTDESAAYIVYVADLTLATGDVNVMPPLLVKAVYLNLAAKLAWAMQQNRSLKSTLEELSMAAMKKARAADAQEEFRPLMNLASQSRWVSGRVSSTNG